MKHNKEVEQTYITSWLLVVDALTSGQKKAQTSTPLLHCDVHTATLRCWLLLVLSLLLVTFLLGLVSLLFLLLSESLLMWLWWGIALCHTVPVTVCNKQMQICV